MTISDGAGGTATSHVTVNLTPVNAAPVAVDDLITLRFGQPLRITAAMLTGNDTDADGDALTLVSLSAPLRVACRRRLTAATSSSTRRPWAARM